MCRDFSFFKRRYFPLYMKVQKKLPFSNRSKLISLLLCIQKKKRFQNYQIIYFNIFKTMLYIFIIAYNSSKNRKSKNVINAQSLLF